MKIDPSIKIYLAPLEGVTTRTFREVFRRHFGSVDRFYTPFLVANHTRHFKRRESGEIIPFDKELVPQILTSNSDDFIWAASYLKSLGYQEVNLNLGCPYPTVFSKGKGSGMLRDPERLTSFFDEIFAAEGLPKISVKTRIGVSDPSEAVRLAGIFDSFPLAELIIHPRLRNDFYEGKPNIESFRAMLERVRCPVAFNGDICTSEDASRIVKEFPNIHAIMIGRGLISDPSIADVIRGNSTAGDKDLLEFLDDLWRSYRAVLYGDRDVLFKMKELWYYIGKRFPEKERALLDIRKAKTDKDYWDAVMRILDRR